MTSRKNTNRSSRRGSIVVLAAFLLVGLLGVIAFATDLGYIYLVKTQLQAAADAAALAGAANMAYPDTAVSDAKKYAALNKAGGVTVTLSGTDVEFGIWNTSTRIFTPSNDQSGNAMRITVRRNDATGGNSLFFAKIFGKKSFETSAQAIAMANPRDICLLVDLSASMHYDTEPDNGYASAAMTGTYATVQTTMMQKVFNDLNYGTAPGTTQTVGQILGASSTSTLASKLMNSSVTYSGTTYTISSTYKILSTDSGATKKQKMYKWLIDVQMPLIMPNATPPLTSSNTTYYNYWAAYLDKIAASSSNRLGYLTYVYYMMYNGRDGQDSTLSSSDDSPLAVTSPYGCIYHSETVGSESFNFPARGEPTHSCRRALIAAIQQIQERNSPVSDDNQKDWVSVISFDALAGTTIQHDLDVNYTTAKQACTKLQPVHSGAACTATETGMIAAENLIKAASKGGKGRENTQKVVVLLTDGVPNLKTSSNSTISNYISSNSNSNYYNSSTYYNYDAALMQTALMQKMNWKVFAVGVGLETDNSFMDRIARMGETNASHSSTDPTAYEENLRAIFKQIVDNPEVRLVK